MAIVYAILIAKTDMRLAFRWVLTFAYGMLLVGATKILHYAWAYRFHWFIFA